MNSGKYGLPKNRTYQSSTNASTALSGGTDTYIPLWSGSSSLTSSFLNQYQNTLKTIYNGNDIGLSLDFTHNVYALGDYGDVNHTTRLEVDDTSQIIKTRGFDGETGLNLNFAINTYKFGDFDHVIGDPSGIQASSGTLTALASDNLNLYTNYGDVSIKGNYIQIGDISANDGNKTKIVVDDTAQTITVSGSLQLSGSLNILKAGSGSAASFAGTPLILVITFGTAFSNNSYSVQVIGEDARVWSVQSKSSTGFTINSNSSIALTGPVYWMATPFNS